MHGTKILDRWGRPAALALLLTVVTLAIVWTDLPHRSADSGWYLKIARGEGQEVPAPFAGRLVHTGLARLLTNAGLDPEWAFVVLAVLAFWITLTVIFGLHRRGGVPVPVTVFAVVGWLAAALLRDATLPDIHAAAWLSLITVAAVYRSLWVFPLLVGAILCRESLTLFGLVLAVMAWRDRPRFALALITTMVVGLGASSLLSGAGNVHGIRGPLYLATKFLFNFSRNVCGWELYVETIDYCEPIRTWTLPAWVPSGDVREVGVCGFNPRRPLWLLVAWSGLFGVIPGLLWARRERVRAAWSETPIGIRAALIFGLIMALVAPMSGSSLERLVGYGWPAFWLATPLLVGSLTGDRRQGIILGILQVTAAWGLLLLAWSAPVSVPVLAVTAALGLGMNVGAAVLVERRR